MKICGTVIRGNGRGKQLGFPTANISPASTPDIETGVYAGVALVESKKYAAAIHIGPRPTFNDTAQTIEVHILDFSRDIYDDSICISVDKKIRDIEKFDTIEALKCAIARDCEIAQSIFEQ